MPKAKAAEKAVTTKPKAAAKKPAKAKAPQFEQPERVIVGLYYEVDTLGLGPVRGQLVDDGAIDGRQKLKIWKNGEPKDELYHIAFVDFNVREVTRTYLMEQTA